MFIASLAGLVPANDVFEGARRSRHECVGRSTGLARRRARSVPDQPAKRIHELLPWNWRRQIAHPPAISRIRATKIRNFAFGSRAWSRTTGGTPPSLGRTNCSVMLRD